MPFESGTFVVPFRFVDLFNAGDEIPRAPLDNIFSDFAAGINAVNSYLEGAGLSDLEPAVLATVDSADTVSGFYRTIPDTLGTFPTSQKYGGIFVWRHNATDFLQMFWNVIDDKIWYRRYRAALGGFQTWRLLQRELSRVRQVIPAASLTTPFALDYAPRDIDHLDVIIDGVVQEPSEFSLSGANVSYAGSAPVAASGWPDCIVNISFTYWREV